MKDRGTTGAGEPQITGVPRVHRHLKRTHGRCTTGNAILLCQTQWNSPIDTMRGGFVSFVSPDWTPEVFEVARELVLRGGTGRSPEVSDQYHTGRKF